jgi:hypothetical protein
MAMTKIVLSGSTDGIPYQSDGTDWYTIHTASSTATDFDEVWLWACNPSGTDRLAYVGWGSWGTTATQTKYTVAKQDGLFLVIPGLAMKGNASSPKIVSVYSGTANAINWVGYVNRHSA